MIQQDVLIYDQKPIIYLYSPIRITAIRKKFKNIYPTALSGLIYNLDEIYIDGDLFKVIIEFDVIY